MLQLGFLFAVNVSCLDLLIELFKQIMFHFLAIVTVNIFRLFSLVIGYVTKHGVSKEGLVFLQHTAYINTKQFVRCLSRHCIALCASVVHMLLESSRRLCFLYQILSEPRLNKVRQLQLF